MDLIGETIGRFIECKVTPAIARRGVAYNKTPIYDIIGRNFYKIGIKKVLLSDGDNSTFLL